MPKKNEALFTSNSDIWATPQDLYDNLNKKHKFTLDPCANEENHKCEKWFSEEQDGLSQSWKDEIVFVNPPYSQISKWVDKCIKESKENNAKIVLLVPARPDTKHFKKCFENACYIGFIHGRLKFGNSTNSAPFPSAIFYFDKNILKEYGIVFPEVRLYDKVGNLLS